MTVEFTESDSCMRNYQFDIFVRQTLLPPDRYDLVLKKIDDAGRKNDYIEALKEPHFKMKSRYSERVFYADAKYIPRISGPVVEWCEPLEFRRYRELDNKTPVFILIGEGSQPEAPQHIFLFPVKNLKNNRMPRLHMDKFMISTSSGLDEEHLLSLRLSN